MTAPFTVLEQSITPKSADRVCEDGLVITGHHAAVIDGATTPHAIGNDGRTTGKIAMDALTTVIESLEPDATVDDFLLLAAAAIADAAAAAGLDPQLPTAVAVIYSHARHQVWSIGDAHCAIDGIPLAGTRRIIDDLAAQSRAVILTAALRTGATVDELRRTDPGRVGTAALREAKVIFRNAADAGPLAFAALTGSPVPRELVDVYSATGEVVLASDGYLHAAPTLATAEADLAEALAQDPLCIGVNPATKCPARPGDSFDDRTYVRLQTAW